MNADKTTERASKQRFSSLLALTIFIFSILLVSIVIAALLSHLLISVGLFPPITEKRFPAVILFMLIVSLFIGTLIAAIGGSYLLQPLRRLTDATKEIAAGNFDVRVEETGPAEFVRLATSFNNMAHELSGIETLGNDFVSNISHEFKTPVVSIRGFAKRLKKDTLTERQREEYLDIIISETEHLTQLSQNVLLLSSLESSDRMTGRGVYSLDEQIRKCVLTLEPQFRKKRLQLDIDMAPVMIDSSEEMLSHLWINILANAIKFSPEGGCIEISLESDGDYACVSVADEGIGMDEETSGHIFDKFYQGDPSRSTEGNGLGLSLVKRILLLCGGEIEVNTAPGCGTCFIVTLPLGI